MTGVKSHAVVDSSRMRLTLWAHKRDDVSSVSIGWGEELRMQDMEAEMQGNSRKIACQ
jgi:hypothetical protein